MARADTTTPDRADLLYEAATGLAFTAPYPTIVVEPAPRATTSATASYRYAWIGAPSGAAPPFPQMQERGQSTRRRGRGRPRGLALV
jgi:hypothetical protein